MISLIIEALVAFALTMWISKDSNNMEMLWVILFVVLVNSFEIGRLHRKINALSKEKRQARILPPR